MSRPRNYVSALPAPQPAITVVMAALALVTMVALFLTATAAVTVPIGVVLAMAAMATTVRMVKERARRHKRRPSNQPNVRRATAEPPDVPGWDELGILRAAMVVMAFLVPPALGLGLLAVGLAGLLSFASP